MSLKDVQALADSFENCSWKDFSEVVAAKEELNDYLSGCYAEISLKKIRLMVQELIKLAELQGYCYGMAIAADKEKERRANGNE